MRRPKLDRAVLFVHPSWPVYPDEGQDRARLDNMLYEVDKIVVGIKNDERAGALLFPSPDDPHGYNEKFLNIFDQIPRERSMVVEDPGRRPAPHNQPRDMIEAFFWGRGMREVMLEYYGTWLDRCGQKVLELTRGTLAAIGIKTVGERALGGFSYAHERAKAANAF